MRLFLIALMLWSTIFWASCSPSAPLMRQYPTNYLLVGSISNLVTSLTNTNSILLGDSNFMQSVITDIYLLSNVFEARVTDSFAGYSTNIAYATNSLFTQTYHPVWCMVGQPGFSAGPVSSLALDLSGGDPVVAFRDASNGNKLTVMRFSNGNWIGVGGAGFTAGAADYISLFTSGGRFVVSCQIAGGAVSVMEYSGGSWQYLGNSGFTGGSAQYTSIAAVGADLYTACYLVSPGTIGLYRLSNAQWIPMGSNTNVLNNFRYISLSFDSGNPYVAYFDGFNGNHASVKQCASDIWSNLGNPGFSAGAVSDVDMKWSGGIPYVCYKDGAYSDRATVMAFSNGTWSALGNPGFSPDVASGTSLEMVLGMPVVVFSDASRGQRAVAMIFSNGNWRYLGDPGFSPGPVLETKIACNGDGPFVAFRDGTNGNRASVMVFK